MLASGFRWWVACKLVFTPLPEKRDKLQLKGASGLRACFQVRKGTGDGENQQDDAQDLEAACEAALLGKPQPKVEQKAADGDGSDAIEAAFDEFFGPSGVYEDDALSDDTASSDAGGDGEEDVGRCGDESDGDRSEEEWTHTHELFTRRGNKLFWDGAQVGRLTQWRGAVSCHCGISGHKNCKTPASINWPTDSVLVDWVLHGLQANLDRDEHVRLAQLLHEQHRRRLLE